MILVNETNASSKHEVFSQDSVLGRGNGETTYLTLRVSQNLRFCEQQDEGDTSY